MGTQTLAACVHFAVNSRRISRKASFGNRMRAFTRVQARVFNSYSEMN